MYLAARRRGAAASSGPDDAVALRRVAALIPVGTVGREEKGSTEAADTDAAIPGALSPSLPPPLMWMMIAEANIQ